MPDGGVTLGILGLVAAGVAACALTYGGCRAWLRSPRFGAWPGPVRCAVFWATPAAAFLLVPLAMVFPDVADAAEAVVAVPIAALAGLAFGVACGLSAGWGPGAGGAGHRALAGALCGAVLALACGLLVHQLLTGWGGPGGGAFRRPPLAMAVLWFSALVPLLAVAGVATPRRVVVPAPAQSS